MPSPKLVEALTIYDTLDESLMILKNSQLTMIYITQKLIDEYKIDNPLALETFNEEIILMHSELERIQQNMRYQLSLIEAIS